MQKTRFTDSFKEAPFWWERTPRPTVDITNTTPPAFADVVIIGSGYTGLSAAIQTAQHGRHTVVLDAEHAGWGCSSRNGGQVSTSLKPTFPMLSKKYGKRTALEILREGNNALEWIESFIAENNIDCDFHKVGRFHAAHTPKAFQKLKKKIRDIPSELNIGAYEIAPRDLHTEIGSDLYHGGVVYPHHASLDPARYHQGLLDYAISKGVEIVSHCKVTSIHGGRAHHGNRNYRLKIATTKGAISTGDVVVATSGYTGHATPWQQRRIIPVGTYMIATEELPQATIKRLIPNNRVVTDTRKLVVYYRTCPQRRRILFGGRVSLKEISLQTSARLLRRQMVRLFPELESARISHSWMGFVGYSFDEMPHNGEHDGIFYSMGYCGSGISLASYFGMRTGQKVIDHQNGATALDRLTFQARPYYRGNPWFLTPALAYHRWQDEREAKRGR